MVSGRRLVSIWFALHLSVGIGVMGITSALFEQSEVPPGVPLLVGAFGALVTAIVILRRYPKLESSLVWRFGILTSVSFVVGNVLTEDGIYAQTGEGSPILIGLLWFASMGVAYLVTVGGSYAELVNRLVSR